MIQPWICSPSKDGYQISSMSPSSTPSRMSPLRSVRRRMSPRRSIRATFGVDCGAECTAAAADRVYRHCFSDWRVLVDGGAANGGRDDPMAILVETVPGASANGTEGTAVEADDALLARSATYDDRWYEDGLVVHCHHPSWPQTSVLPSGRREY